MYIIYPRRGRLPSHLCLRYLPLRRKFYIIQFYLRGALANAPYINHANACLSSRTPLKAERFERDDAFFLKKLSLRESHLLTLLRFFLKKMKRDPTPHVKLKGNIKNKYKYFTVFYEPTTLTTKHSKQTAVETPYLKPYSYWKTSSTSYHPNYTFGTLSPL